MLLELLLLLRVLLFVLPCLLWLARLVFQKN